MAVGWNVDSELETALWRPIRELALAAARKAGGGRILDIGGGGGGFSYYISMNVRGFTPVSVDIAPAPPSPYAVDTTLGDALRLPFKDSSFDMLVARAVLHHFPERIGDAMREAKRVLKPGGLFIIEEPCSGNPLAAIARGAMPTDRHDPGERPMAREFMLKAIGQQFTILEARSFFLTSYLLPHLVSRMPAGFKPAFRKLSLTAGRLDERIIEKWGFSVRFASYIHILAIKSK